MVKEILEKGITQSRGETKAVGRSGADDSRMVQSRTTLKGRSNEVEKADLEPWYKKTQIIVGCKHRKPAITYLEQRAK